MKRLKRLFLISLLLVIACTSQACPLVSVHGDHDGTIRLCKPDGQEHKSDALRGFTFQQDGDTTALLSDASTIYRICNSRPQRVLPIFHAPHQHLSGRNPFLFSSNYNLKNIHGWVGLIDFLPCHSTVPSDYYIIALRHIIR